MSSIVLELQKDLLDKDCDILQALRKAHVIAVKLHLTEFLLQFYQWIIKAMPKNAQTTAQLH